MLDRTLGEEIPISIGTAIPFEKRIATIDVRKETDAVVMNARTLWRNYYGSFKVDQPPVREILPGFIEELNTIRGLCNTAQLASGIYVPDYRYIKYQLPKAIIREPAPKEVHYYKSENMVMDLLKTQQKALQVHPIKLRLPSINARTWMLTHSPVDLLNRYQFRDLKVIDSHTGDLKGPSSWLLKITKNPDYVRIPFNVLSLVVFGDQRYIAGWPLKYRRVLLELSIENNWTPLTTKEKIIANLKSYKDQKLADELIKVFNISFE